MAIAFYRHALKYPLRFQFIGIGFSSSKPIPGLNEMFACTDSLQYALLRYPVFSEEFLLLAAVSAILLNKHFLFVV